MIVPVAITVHVAFYTQTILDAESGALIHAPYLALTPTRSVRAGGERKRGVFKRKRGHKKETRVPARRRPSGSQTVTKQLAG